MSVSSASVHSGAQGAERESVGRAVLTTTLVAFTAVALPLVWRGAPVADDFNNCLAPQELGLGGFIAASWQQLGAIRPGRVLEILVTGSVCQSLPFGVAIAVSLACTLIVAFVTRRLLRDLDIAEPWASLGAALWLLQPLGTEAALWPAALHVPLGLAISVQALRCYRRRQYVWAATTNLIAAFCIEQVILPMPLAAALVSVRGARHRAALVSSLVAAIAIAAFIVWPGDNPRLQVTVIERLRGLVANPAFYVGYPAVGLGLHSIPLAIRWAWPWGMLLLVSGGAAGWRVGRRIGSFQPRGDRPRRAPSLLAIAALIVLANVVVILAVPQQGSPRVFAPTWLILAIAAAVWGPTIRWRHAEAIGTIGGVCAAGAVLSLAFSVSVRITSANFTERAAAVIAARVPEGGRVALCNVRRTVVEPAPRGAFAVHEFIYDWAAPRALLYYTHRHATFYLSGEMWNRPCPPPADFDAVISFNDLLAVQR